GIFDRYQFGEDIKLKNEDNMEYRIPAGVYSAISWAGMTDYDSPDTLELSCAPSQYAVINRINKALVTSMTVDEIKSFFKGMQKILGENKLNDCKVIDERRKDYLYINIEFSLDNKAFKTEFRTQYTGTTDERVLRLYSTIPVFFKDVEEIVYNIFHPLAVELETMAWAAGFTQLNVDSNELLAPNAEDTEDPLIYLGEDHNPIITEKGLKVMQITKLLCNKDKEKFQKIKDELYKHEAIEGLLVTLHKFKNYYIAENKRKYEKEIPEIRAVSALLEKLSELMNNADKQGIWIMVGGEVDSHVYSMQYAGSEFKYYSMFVLPAILNLLNRNYENSEKDMKVLKDWSGFDEDIVLSICGMFPAGLIERMAKGPIVYERIIKAVKEYVYVEREHYDGLKEIARYRKTGSWEKNEPVDVEIMRSPVLDIGLMEEVLKSNKLLFAMMKLKHCLGNDLRFVREIIRPVFNLPISRALDQIRHELVRHGIDVDGISEFDIIQIIKIREAV
ncbi:MAG: hypothetical protein ABH857_01240, partial [Elusimicrobiota bacterium]